MYPITLTTKLKDIELCGLKLGELDHPDFTYPWEIIKWHQETMVVHLDQASQHGGFKILGSHTQVQVSGTVSIGEYVVFNETHGPIVIDEGALINPFSYIEGPCYIGKNVEIMPHTQIRKNTSIAHTCKIGGEVAASIFQPYSNKAHYGFVGDSYIGSWVNLGAGTTTSNLKNTYGSVRVEYNGEKIDTGMQFLGCIMGDYVKTAVNTAIYTGKIIGVYAQLFGTVNQNVGPFVMALPEGNKEFELDAAIRTQKRMFERRGVDQSSEDVVLVSQVFKETEASRKAECGA